MPIPFLLLRVFSAECVISTGNNICTAVENLVSGLLYNTVTVGRIFAVANAKINAFFLCGDSAFSYIRICTDEPAAAYISASCRSFRRRRSVYHYGSILLRSRKGYFRIRLLSDNFCRFAGIYSFRTNPRYSQLDRIYHNMFHGNSYVSVQQKEKKFI